MSKEEKIIKLKEIIKQVKTVEEVYAIFIEMYEQDYTDQEIKEVLEQMQLSEEIKEEMEKEGFSLK